MIQAARYLQVAPWDLLRQPVWWTRWAHILAEAEAEARSKRK